MELTGIRPEVHINTIVPTPQGTSQEELTELVVEQTLNTNHDAPGVDEADASTITGIGGNLNITA